MCLLFPGHFVRLLYMFWLWYFPSSVCHHGHLLPLLQSILWLLHLFDLCLRYQISMCRLCWRMLSLPIPFCRLIINPSFLHYLVFRDVWIHQHTQSPSIATLLLSPFHYGSLCRWSCCWICTNKPLSSRMIHSSLTIYRINYWKFLTFLNVYSFLYEWYRPRNMWFGCIILSFILLHFVQFPTFHLCAHWFFFISLLLVTYLFFLHFIH